MASTFSNLKFELIGTGDQSGTWGTTTNTNLGTAIEQALVGMATISSGFTGSPLTLTLTLTDTNAAQNARALVLNLTQSLGGVGVLNVPAIQKPYMIINATGQTVTVKVTGLTGVAVPNGTRAFLYNNGTDVGDFFNYASSLTLGTALPITSGGTGTTSTTFVNLATNVTGTLPIANGGTGTTSTTFVNLATNVTGTLPVANGGTGTTSTTFVNLATNVTGTLPIANGGTGTTSTTFVNLATNVTGTLPVANGGTGGATQAAARTGIGATTVGSNFFTLTNPSAITFPRMNADNTVSALDAATFRTAIGAGTGSGTVTSVSGTGTVQGLSLSGTVTGSGNITLGGSLSAVSLTTQVSGTLPVGNGGTGAATFTANNVLLGNGTSAFQTVAPGTAGNVLTSNGTTWASSTPAGGALTNNTRQAVTSSATTTINLNSGNVIDLTMAANITTLSFTNVPASGTPILVQIVVKNASDGTAYTITWPNSVYWSGQYVAATNGTVQTAPTLASGANGVTVIALLTTDGGTKWRGWVEATIPGGVLAGLYSWGANPDGRLGQNNLTYRSSPIQVGSLTDWASVAAGNNFGASTKTDGTLWAWGFNSNGQLGQGATISRSSPVQVGSLTNWASVTAGVNFCAAIKTDGTLWTWGLNDQGRLGQNSTIQISSPTQVGSLTNWSSVAAHTAFCAAVKTDGTMWTWGYNIGGCLGLNDTVYRSSPTQVGALTNWARVSMGELFCIAIKTDGTLWGWGDRQNGKLGLNTATGYLSSPIQIGALTDWSTISCGSKFSLAIKTNGTLWSWGFNNFGQLGLNSTSTVSSPIQIGALTNWASVSAGDVHCLSVKTDSTLWSWGDSGQGRLGQNASVTLSSPVQVGSLTNWASASASKPNGAFTLARAGTAVNPA